MQQAIVIVATRYFLQNPRAVRWFGSVVAAVAAVALVFAVRAYRVYPREPERMTLADALARADSGRGNDWVRIAAPAVRCDLAARDDSYTYVPISGRPLVLAALEPRLACASLDARDLVGTIRRPPPRWVERVVGTTTETAVYELSTWGGPGNMLGLVYVAIGGVVLGLLLIVLGPALVRRSEKRQQLAA